MEPAGTHRPDQGDRRAVTAFFDDRAAAQTAIDDLVAAGTAREAITLVEGGVEPVAEEAKPSSELSIWDKLKHLFLAEADHHAYGEGLRRGGFLLSVETASAEHDQVVALLDRDGAVDMDAREADWALEGWDPAKASAVFRPSDLAPSVPVGPAFGQGEPRAAPPEAGPTVIRDPGAPTPRLRTYVAGPPRDPQDGAA